MLDSSTTYRIFLEYLQVLNDWHILEPIAFHDISLGFRNDIISYIGFEMNADNLVVDCHCSFLVSIMVFYCTNSIW